jgi:hypothetical protein
MVQFGYQFRLGPALNYLKRPGRHAPEMTKQWSTKATNLERVGSTYGASEATDGEMSPNLAESKLSMNNTNRRRYRS